MAIDRRRRSAAVQDAAAERGHRSRGIAAIACAGVFAVGAGTAEQREYDSRTVARETHERPKDARIVTGQLSAVVDVLIMCERLGIRGIIWVDESRRSQMEPERR